MAGFLGHVTALLMMITVGGHTTTLYSFDEPIAQLDSSNFTIKVTNSEQLWALEFYATWCGHCQRFASTWVNFAKNIERWNNYVVVGAVACSDPSNTAICRYYNVLGYPTIKFFPPYTSLRYRGHDYSGAKSIDDLRRAVIDYIDTVTIKPEEWPSLETYRDLTELLQKARNGHRVYIIFEDQFDAKYDQFIGKELVMDVSDLPNVALARMTRHDGIRYDIRDYPSLHRLNPDVSFLQIARNLDRNGFYEVLREDLQGWLPIHGQPSSARPTTTQTAVTSTIGSQNLPQSVSPGVHMQDLESGLYYSLWLEVSGRRSIYGRTMEALKTYIHTLKKYFPGQQNIMTFLNRTASWLDQQGRGMTSRRYLRNINRIKSSPDANVPERLRWTGCAGSEPRFRGYPCSLWTTFHTLTVSAYEKHINDPTYDPQEVLKAIRGYVHYFLGCRDCANHFVRMAQTLEEEVQSPADGILWLWKGHNKVNKRLSGDLTDDPIHPKELFPSEELCPACRSQTTSQWHVTWNEPVVLNFLHQFYNAENIIQDALPVTTSAPVQTVTPRILNTLRHPTRPSGIQHTYGQGPARPSRVQDTLRHGPERHFSRNQDTFRHDLARPSINQDAFRQGPTATPRILYANIPAWRPAGVPISTYPTPVATRIIPIPINNVNPPYGPDPQREGILENVPTDCRRQSSDWTPCSVTCGVGISTRMSNENFQCRMEMEMRLCKLRPCNAVYTDSSNGCGATFRSSTLEPIIYGNCRSLLSYQWRYCGQCPDQCCHPVTDHTYWMTMACDDQVGYAKVHWIYFCACSNHCP